MVSKKNNCNSDSALLVFSRIPVAGKLKRRLGREIGAKAAYDWYIRIAERTLGLGAKARYTSKQLWLTGDAEEVKNNTLCQHWLTQYGYEFHQQQGADLGVRMQAAFASALQQYAQAVLIGCDCPELCLDDLHQAQHFLNTKIAEDNTAVKPQAVIGSSHDGGYYLIGLTHNCPAAFTDIRWGTDEVAKNTRERLQQQGFSLHELSIRQDVDCAADLAAINI